MTDTNKSHRKIRTRFAPSPTGTLHIGGARTALFSWLYARRHGGDFILRIEDTDRERSTDESVQAIFESMAWLGLDADEEPIFQSHRFARYQEVLDQLLSDGHAYHCYCTREELDARREVQIKAKIKARYDGKCRHLTEPRNGVSSAVRFKNPLDGEVVFNDLVRGEIRFANNELDDLIIARSDGTPTYNFTVVVDDLDMEISHVIRGDDHINNTPRQINIMSALAATIPVYAHVPMILGADGARLSKRHGAVGVMSYRDQGFLPEALLNYLVRLGWSHGDQELFSIEELIGIFDLEDVNRAPSVFNTDKLLWLNQMHIKNLPASELGQRLRPYLATLGIEPACEKHLAAVADCLRERAKTMTELASNAAFFFRAPEAYDKKAAKKFLNADSIEILHIVRRYLEQVKDWAAPKLHESLTALSKDNELKFGAIAQPIRTAIAGVAVSPSIDITLELLGREPTLERIDAAIAWAATRAKN